MTRALAFAALLLLATPAFAESLVGSPVPETLLEVRGTESEESLATSSVAALEQALRSSENDALLDARARLVLLGDVGLRHVAERLATSDVSDLLLPHLLHVVASSEHEGADVLLTRAAEAERAEIRMRAAVGLGWGRTPAAVAALTTLARDPVAGVRAAALRSLFALESDAAVAARQALPVDPRPDLHARRLHWHRRRGHATADLQEMVLRTWRGGRTPEERLEAAQLLALPPLATPLPVLEEIVAELGTDALGAGPGGLAPDDPHRGYDPLLTRQAAILAAWMAYYHADADATVRASLADRAVGWLARPVKTDPHSKRPLPQNILRMVLPDLGDAVTEPTTSRLRTGGFRDPQDGVALLVEALPETSAAEALLTLLDPEADPKVSAPVRVAAAGGLNTLGLVGDEHAARLLLRTEEEPPIRRSVLSAVGGDPAPWAVPLLGEMTATGDRALVPRALNALEARLDDDRARQILVEYLFARARDPAARLRVLVERGDDGAYEVLERALAHGRGELRRAALRQFSEVPSLATDRSRALLRAYTVLATGPNERTHEIQQVLYAYFALLPQESVPWMREHWGEFEKLDWAHTALKSLQNLKAKEALEAVVDLVLEQAAQTDDLRVLQEAATALRDRSGYRDEELDAFWRRLLTHGDGSIVTYALPSLMHPGRGDLTRDLLALFADLDLSSETDFFRAISILDVLEHQPWEAVEEVVLALLFDVGAVDELRRRAGRLLVGRASEPARQRLVDWLTDPASANTDPIVLRLTARVVGEGKDPEVARRCLEALRERLESLYATGRFSDPLEEREAEFAFDVPALVLAVAFTGHRESLTRLAGLLFDQRLARFARRAMEGQARCLAPTDATGAGHLTPRPFALWLRTAGGYGPVPGEIHLALGSLKAADDDVLVAALEETLSAAHASGALAAFPDTYLDRVMAALRWPETGTRARAADVVASYVARTEPVGGAVDFFVARARAEHLARDGRFAEAAEVQREVLAILSRRAYDDEPTWNWRRERAALDALLGAAAQAEGDPVGAEEALQRAVTWNALDAGLLQQTAQARAESGCGLETALALALRARTLEWRVFDTMGVPTGDTLAHVCLQLGRFDEAARAMHEVFPRVKPEPQYGGRYHLRLAEALAASGEVSAATTVVEQALAREPTLGTRILSDPWLEPLDRRRLEELVDQAKARAFEALMD